MSSFSQLEHAGAHCSVMYDGFFSHSPEVAQNEQLNEIRERVRDTIILIVRNDGCDCQIWHDTIPMNIQKKDNETTDSLLVLIPTFATNA